MPRTIERIAIAALAAIAARGSGESLATAAIAVFIIVVVIEELGRNWIWYGKKVTLRDVALGSIGDLRLRRAKLIERRKRQRRRSAVERRRGEAALDQTDEAIRKLQTR
jgi:hypothetical protein